MVRDRRITKRRRRPPYPPPIDTLSYLELLDSAGYIAAMYLADEITEATYTQHGPELVVNGDFTDWTADDPDGWAVSEVGDATSNVTENPTGRCQIISTGTNAQITQTVLTVGDTYTVTGTATAVDAGRLKVRLGSEVGKIDGVGAFSITAIADGTAFTIARDSTPCDVTISNVSVKKNGFAGSILRNAAYTDEPGPELTTNGDFADWTADVPDVWDVFEVGDATSDVTENPAGQCQMISDGFIVHLKQLGILTAGVTYRVTMDVSAITGSVRWGSGGNWELLTTTGSKTFEFIAGGVNFFIQRETACNITFDNVSIKKVGHLDAALKATAWGASGGLIYDGATSLATVANHADLAGLTSQAWAFLATADSDGESTRGTFYATDTDPSLTRQFRMASVERIYSVMEAATTDSVALTDNNEFETPPVFSWAFMDHDDADVFGNGRKMRLHKGLNGAVTTMSLDVDSAVVGAFAVTANDFTIGNTSDAASTFDGTFWKIIIWDATALPFIDGINAILTILAGV